MLVYDKGSEFKKEFADMIVRDYGIKPKPITTRNPQSNSVLERVHQTIGNMLRTTNLHELDTQSDDPFAGILSAVLFATRATYHMTLQAMPMQLVCGRDAMLNIPVQANWHRLRQNKQRLIEINNRKENSKRCQHEYVVGDKVLYKTRDDKGKYASNPWEGPFKILRVYNNGTVRLARGITDETVNIRLLKPYFE